MSIKLNEMSYPRSEAIDRCASLGEKFIEHFEKSYIGGIDSEDLKHHCAEMQSWYDAVNRMTIKPRAKMLDIDQMINWFFLAGGSLEYMFHNNDDMQNAYNKFIKSLLMSDDVYNSMLKVFA